MLELKNKVSKISTELFKIVTELPEAANADKNKIYGKVLWSKKS